MAKLIVKLKDKTLHEIILLKDVTTIGRDPSNDIRLNNMAVSRFHAKLYRQGWPFYVEDLKSTNGTFLNGKRVPWKEPLAHEDKIKVGKHTLVFIQQETDYGNGGAQGPRVDDTICIPGKR
ncbi:MAG: FHA domain-containing protein [Nitrospirota bacterium]|jgi:pSer/pThr/pTyr-binding forkhead associated (FHA) protein